MSPADVAALRNCISVADSEGYLDGSAASGLDSALLALLRRDWAVRVLDAWAAHHGCITGFETRSELSNHHVCGYGAYQPGGARPTRDAARLAAAEAVWPELPESVRAEIGGAL